MKLIHYDGNTTIQVNEHTYSVDHFKKFMPEYSVPYGFSTRVYERGVQHLISDGHNTIHLSKTDSYCDQICSREGELARLSLRLSQEGR